MRIAMLGTRGVPAAYSGFETAVEEVGSRLAERGHEVHVWCRTERRDPPTYKGMQLHYSGMVKQRSLETLSHTATTVAQIRRRRESFDAILLFNAANAVFLPFLRKSAKGIAVHVDGLEWQRSKWGPMGKSWYRRMERESVKRADALIADAVAIQDYYTKEFDRDSWFISYGAPILTSPPLQRLDELGLTPGGYHLVVARFEPENHVDVAIEGFLSSKAELPLIVVGSVPYPSEHSQRIDALAATSDRVRLLGGIWDQELLDALYAGSVSYTHGHSVGGTNPSLLRAMGAGANVLAWDCVFTREVTGEPGRFWDTPAKLAVLLETTEADRADASARGKREQERASEHYVWDQVADGYEQLCEHLATPAASRQERTK